MTKYLYPAPCALFLTCEVTSLLNGRVIKSKELGSSTSVNASKFINQMTDKAIKNAKVNHLFTKREKEKKEGKIFKKKLKLPDSDKEQFAGFISEMSVRILDYDIRYEKFVKTKRITIKNPDTKKSEYWSTAESKNTGIKLGDREKWKKADINTRQTY